MYEIFCIDFSTGRTHVMKFEVKASVFDYSSLFVSFTDHGMFKITDNGKFLLSRSW